MAHIILFIDTVHFSLKDDLTNLGFECIEAYTWSVDEIKIFLPKVYGIVIRSRFKLTASVLEQAKNLKFIARFGAGLENIDVPFATSRGILCLNAPDGNRNAVAEHTLGLMLSLFKKINTSHREVQQGLWRREDNRGIELEGKTVAIIGYGNTGSQLVKLLHGFDINCLVYDKYKSSFGTPFVKEVQDYETIFEQADVISFHVPLTDETHYLVNAEFLGQFKKPFYLFNTSRGPVVQTTALVQALQTKQVLGCGLDVLEYEQVSFEHLQNNPNLTYLQEATNVILTPHIAGWSHESNVKMAQSLVRQIKELALF